MKHPAERTIQDLETVMEEMQFLVDHPRMQQKRWVAKGKVWLPILQNAKEDLQHCTEPHDMAIEGYQAIMDVLSKLGLEVKKRDATSWGYSWHGEPLKGGFASQTQAIEAALSERLS